MCTITSCEYAAICRKQYGRDRDPVGNGCLLSKVSVKGSAFLSLHVGSGDGTTFCEVTMQGSPLGWRTVQSCLFRCHNAEFSVRMGNGSSCLFRYNNAEFYVEMGNGSVLSFSI